MTGAELLVETLRAHGVKTLFTLSGNQMIDSVAAPTYRATPGAH